MKTAPTVVTGPRLSTHAFAVEQGAPSQRTKWESDEAVAVSLTRTPKPTDGLVNAGRAALDLAPIAAGRAAGHGPGASAALGHPEVDADVERLSRQPIAVTEADADHAVLGEEIARQACGSSPGSQPYTHVTTVLVPAGGTAVKVSGVPLRRRSL